MQDSGQNYVFSLLELSQIAQDACLLEVSTPKPGNVSPDYNFSDMTYQDFLFSSSAISGSILKIEHLTIGEAVLTAVKETRKYVKTNTNLGTILLLIPLTKAYYVTFEQQGEEITDLQQRVMKLRTGLKELLSKLTVDDARKVYQAVRLVDAGGMGEVNKGDVKETPDITLREAMKLSKDRDNIAREYITDFEITFNIGYPTLKENFSQAENLESAILQTYMTLLAEVPDTLIARKTSFKKAKEVSNKAQEVLDLGGVYSKEGRQKIEELSDELCDSKNLYNPGTTADITAAVIFIFILIKGFKFFEEVSRI